MPFDQRETLAEEVATDVVGRAGEQDFQVEPGSLPSHYQTKRMRKLLRWVNRESGFLRPKSPAGEDAVQSAEMTTDLGPSIRYRDKAAAESERINSSLERGSPVGKMLSNGITHATGRSFMKGRVN